MSLKAAMNRRISRFQRPLSAIEVVSRAGDEMRERLAAAVARHRDADRLFAAGESRSRTAPGGAVYHSKEELVLRHGRCFEPRRLPRLYGRRRAKECFANAFTLASTHDGLRYAEGFAEPVADCPLLVHHAWCVDAEGRVVDATWSPVGVTYFGVVFPLGVVAASWSEHNQSVLDDWPHGFPVLQTRFVEEAR